MNKKFKNIFILAFMFFLISSSFYSVKANDTYNYDEFYKAISDLSHENKNNYVGTLKFYIGNNNMFVDEQQKPIDTAPVMIENRVFLPIRAITEQGGGSITYSENNIYINDSGNSVELKIGNNKMYVNKNEIILDTPPVIINDRTLVPLRAVSESLGYNVVWDEENQTVILSKDFQIMRLIIKAKYDNFNPDEYGAVKVIKGPDLLYILQFDSIADTQKCYKLLIDLGQIEFAEPDKYIPPITEKPKEDVKDSNMIEWGAERIKAPEYAQKLLQNGVNSQAVIAVIDTGVDANHSYLSGRVLSDSGYNFVSGNKNTNDDHYHGTHVAGIIAECTPGLNIKVLPIKALGSDGSGSDLAVGAGIQYAINEGADVINLSLREPCTGTSHYLDSMIQKAISQNITVVVASGNDSANTRYFCPSHSQEAIIVGASDINDNIASFSNYGNSVDVAAPGVDILSTIPGNRFAYLSGTSMASPHVAAIAAMYRLEHENWTPEQIKSEIKLNSDDRGAAGWDPFYGQGIPNLFAEEPTPIPEPTTTPEPESEPINIPEIPQASDNTDSYIAGLNCSIYNNKLMFSLKTTINASKVDIYFNNSNIPNSMTKKSNSWSYETEVTSVGTLEVKIAVYDMNGNSKVSTALLNIIYR